MGSVYATAHGHGRVHLSQDQSRRLYPARLVRCLLPRRCENCSPMPPPVNCEVPRPTVVCGIPARSGRCLSNICNCLLRKLKPTTCASFTESHSTKRGGMVGRTLTATKLRPVAGRILSCQ